MVLAYSTTCQNWLDDFYFLLPSIWLPIYCTQAHHNESPFVPNVKKHGRRKRKEVEMRKAQKQQKKKERMGGRMGIEKTRGEVKKRFLSTMKRTWNTDHIQKKSVRIANPAKTYMLLVRVIRAFSRYDTFNSYTPRFQHFWCQLELSGPSWVECPSPKKEVFYVKFLTLSDSDTFQYLTIACCQHDDSCGCAKMAIFRASIFISQNCEGAGNYAATIWPFNCYAQHNSSIQYRV